MRLPFSLGPAFAPTGPVEPSPARDALVAEFDTFASQFAALKSGPQAMLVRGLLAGLTEAQARDVVTGVRALADALDARLSHHS